ncbi:Hypothetical protein SRAE_0000046900 [Strongyloides ratti]|uniref:Uncharacterized protein n=1 Tax=Strongyloides ratti TaxID=34506 RepID=A0A090MSR7_STRRB|nr:Hypothetical protein SRAE_0000046900 [Strongyloides ratti]CEF61343.1 Hypothetical protein SRAE_0000046900 [Strongyloides ratti]
MCQVPATFGLSNILENLIIMVLSILFSHFYQYLLYCWRNRRTSTAQPTQPATPIITEPFMDNHSSLELPEYRDIRLV